MPAKARPRLYAMLHAAHAVEDEVEAKLNAMGLSAAKLAALQALADAGESLPLTHLAGRLSCVKSNITQLVDRLEADGLVARQADASDRRTKLAALTAAGRRAVKEGTRVMEAAERAVLERLTHEEVHQLHALLGKIGQVG
jgi:DNA-binding MarR family transcriptional regulator